MLQSVIEILTPLFVTIMSVFAIPALMSWMRKNEWIEKGQQSQLLQSALQNAAMAAIAKIGGSPSAGIVNSIRGVAVQEAVSYVNKSVPDTVKKLKLNDEMLAELVQPHIQRATKG